MLTNFGGDIKFVANRLIGPYSAGCPHPDDPDWQDKLDHMSNVIRAPRGEVIVGFTSVLEVRRISPRKQMSLTIIHRTPVIRFRHSDYNVKRRMP